MSKMSFLNEFVTKTFGKKLEIGKIKAILLLTSHKFLKKFTINSKSLLNNGLFNVYYYAH